MDRNINGLFALCAEVKPEAPEALRAQVKQDFLRLMMYCAKSDGRILPPEVELIRAALGEEVTEEEIRAAGLTRKSFGRAVPESYKSFAAAGEGFAETYLEVYRMTAEAVVSADGNVSVMEMAELQSHLNTLKKYRG